MSSEIVILTGEIGQGKSTKLYNWSRNNAKTKGIIIHFNNDVKCIENIETKANVEYFTDDPNNFSVGRWFIRKEALSFGSEVLEHIEIDEDNIVIVDEIGKLELFNEGFHDAFKSLLLKSKDAPKSIIIVVVRDTLLSFVQAKYSLSKARVITFSELDDYLTSLNASLISYR